MYNALLIMAMKFSKQSQISMHAESQTHSATVVFLAPPAFHRMSPRADTRPACLSSGDG